MSRKIIYALEEFGTCIKHELYIFIDKSPWQVNSNSTRIRPFLQRPWLPGLSSRLPFFRSIVRLTWKMILRPTIDHKNFVNGFPTPLPSFPSPCPYPLASQRSWSNQHLMIMWIKFRFIKLLYFSSIANAGIRLLIICGDGKSYLIPWPLGQSPKWL